MINDHILLDDQGWIALTRDHAQFALVRPFARRYQPDICSICAIASNTTAAFNDLADIVAVGETITLSHIPPAENLDWQHLETITTLQMICEQPIEEPSISDSISVLSEAHIPAIIALQTGSFCPRSYVIGRYLGIWVDCQLVAMAGERLNLGGYREISSVYTHPHFRGRGYARLLVSRLVNMNLAQGVIPFLHVIHDNLSAIELYQRMGFINRRAFPIHVLRRCIQSD